MNLEPSVFLQKPDWCMSNFGKYTRMTPSGVVIDPKITIYDALLLSNHDILIFKIV